MGSDELERGGNASRGGRCATTDRVTPVAVQRSSGTWRSRCLERVPDTDPGHPVPRAPWRVCCQSCCWRGACAPSLKLPSCSAGQRRKAKPPNRTREIRPSGMTTGAVGNVSNDGIVKPPRISKERGSGYPPSKVGAPTIYPNRVLIGSELGHEPEEPDHPTSGLAYQRDCESRLSVDVISIDFEVV